MKRHPGQPHRRALLTASCDICGARWEEMQEEQLSSAAKPRDSRETPGSNPGAASPAERWTVERRVTRAAGDRDKEMPQVIGEGFARFTWACFDTENNRRWCGARHPTKALAVDHAGLLNAGIREERT